MQDVLIEFINDYGYMGIALLILIESVFPPVPSEVILLFGGFLTQRTEMTVPLVIVFATVGATAGASVLYLLGRLLDKEKIKKLFSGKLGKVLHLQAQDAAKAEGWFKRYQVWAVLLCRCVPIVRSLISIPAGMAKMKPLPFMVLTIIGTAVWNTAIVSIGAMAGEAWEKSLVSVEKYQMLLLVLLLGGTAAYILFILQKRRRGNIKKSDKDGGNSES